jgi:hypothetical protein
MIIDREFERAIRQELRDIMPNVILPQDDGTYEVFGKYQIIPEKPGYTVMCHATNVGVFNSSRTALSWCIADKYKDYNLANDIRLLDNKLSFLTNDINVRAAIADRSTRPDFRESIGTKLETKLMQKKIVENQLNNCVDSAKYLQQRGFDNETQRIGRGQPNKTSRQGI